MQTILQVMHSFLILHIAGELWKSQHTLLPTGVLFFLQTEWPSVSNMWESNAVWGSGPLLCHTVQAVSACHCLRTRTCHFMGFSDVSPWKAVCEPGRCRCPGRGMAWAPEPVSRAGAWPRWECRVKTEAEPTREAWGPHCEHCRHSLPQESSGELTAGAGVLGVWGVAVVWVGARPRERTALHGHEQSVDDPARLLAVGL